MKKKGFTLVELLAVIVILAVIGLISVPMILNNIEKSRVSTYRSNTQMLIEASKQYVSKKMEDNDYPQSGINIKDLSFKKGNFKSGIIKRCNEEDVKAGNCTSEEVGEIIAVNIYNGKYCAKGTKQAIEVLKVETEKDCENIDSTSPELTLKVIKATNNSVLIAAYGYDSQSKITKYAFKIGDGEEKVKETESRVATYEFTNLKANQEYEITVSVENENKDNYNETTYKTTKSITVSTLETNIPTFKVSGSGYSSSKEVTITYPKIEGGENYYDITYDGGKTWTTTKANENTTKVVFTKNGKIRAYTKYPGNVVENTLNVIGIDEGGPIFELEVVNENDWEREKVVRVYHKDSDGKKINGALDTGIGLASKAYSFDGGKTWINKYSNAYIKNETVDVIVRDKMGNKTIKSISITRVDRVKPTCTTQYTQPNNYNSSTWTTKNVTIIGRCTDTLGECENRIPTLTLTQDQNSSLSPGKVCDKAGNCTECSKTSVKIDTSKPSKPSVSLFHSTTKTNYTTGGSYNGAWTNKNVLTRVKSTDATSGINYYQFSTDGGKTWSNDISTLGWVNKYYDNKTTFDYWINFSGNWNFYVRSVDKANNVSPLSNPFIIKIDKEDPTCSWSGESTQWTKANRTIKLNAHDTGGSGMNSTTTSKSWTYNKGTTKTANLSFSVKDNAGNTKNCSKTANVYVDKEGPSKPSIALYTSKKSGSDRSNPDTLTTDTNYPSGSWTNKNVMTKAQSNDNGSGVNYYQLTTDGGRTWTNDINTLGWVSAYYNNKTRLDYWINWQGQWNFYVRAVDNVGNVGSASNKFTIRIDQTAPTGYITGGSNVAANDGTASKKTSDTVTINCNDTGGSGVQNASAPVSLADKKGKNVTVGYCGDNAGNITAINANVCKYEANAEHCGSTNKPYNCNPHNCNCKTTKTVVDQYRVDSHATTNTHCKKGYSAACSQYLGEVKCYCKKYNENTSCQTCYDRCNNYVADSCCHF